MEERTTAGWVFTPGASLGGFWDSGISTTSHPIVETLFQRWVGRVSPVGELSFNGRRTHFDAGYSGAAEKYWSADMNWEQRGRLSLRHTATRRFSVFTDASYSAAPTTDRLELVEGVIPYVQVDSSWLHTGGGLQYRLSPRTTLDATYRFERVSIDRPIEAAIFGILRDGYSHAPAIGITRAFTERLSIGGRGEFRREIISGLDETYDDTYDVQTATGEFAYDASRSTSISGGVGVSRLATVYFGGTTSPTFHLGFTHQIRRLEFGARYERAFRPLFGFGVLGTSNSFSGDATMPLGEDRLYYLKANLSYNRTDPVEEIGLAFDFDSLWLNASVGRQLRPWVRGEAFVTVASQSSQIGWPGANRHRIGVQFVTSMPLRIQ
jgi:hypothetical protein